MLVYQRVPELKRPNMDCLSGWWYTYPSEKYEFVSWDDYSQYMESHKIHVPNHQPETFRISIWCRMTRIVSPCWSRWSNHLVMTKTLLLNNYVKGRGQIFSMPHKWAQIPRQLFRQAYGEASSNRLEGVANITPAPLHQELSSNSNKETSNFIRKGLQPNREFGLKPELREGAWLSQRSRWSTQFRTQKLSEFLWDEQTGFQSS